MSSFLAALFVFGGIFRFVSALWLKFPHFGSMAFSGIISFILGILLWIQWPYSAFSFIGFVVGLNFIFAGVAWCGHGDRRHHFARGSGRLDPTRWPRRLGGLGVHLHRETPRQINLNSSLAFTASSCIWSSGRTKRAERRRKP